MKLPKSWTTVTLLSKILAIILFVLLPFIGFYFGVKYSSQIKTYYQEESAEQIIADDDIEILPERVSWNQIGQQYDVWWDDTRQSLKFKDLLFGETREFSSNELFKITGKKNFFNVFKTYGINVQDESLVIVVGLSYTYELPDGGTTTLPKWVKYSVTDEKLTNLPINTTKVLLSGETLFYSDAEYNRPGSISGFNISKNMVEVKFPTVDNNSQLMPVGLSSDGENLIINCFMSESGNFEQDYYFGSAISCGDYLGNFKTGRLIKIQ